MIVISLKSSETPMHNAPKVFLSSKTPNTEEQFRTISQWSSVCSSIGSCFLPKKAYLP